MNYEPLGDVWVNVFEDAIAELCGTDVETLRAKVEESEWPEIIGDWVN